ncbi:RNA polymerase sigma-70 factor [Chitinophaga sp. Mgbs1]|uniref:RNA polymerase sigma-70 factor n=1 Tax=Chitinophaga solisilvae TaxID=1233460 RepID=A0A9Q5DF11_9BACT|nr:RNA polymerase sigma-70 factor [Chitinophaga solisilvae]
MKKGDQRAFECLYERYWLPLLDHAYQRLQSTDAAKDLVQGLFVNLYVRREEIPDIHSPRHYLFRALKYQVLNQLRGTLLRSEKLQQLQAEGLRERQPREQASAHVIEKELEGRLRDAIHLLPEKCREAFLLSRMENLSYKSIALRMGISVNTVEKQIGKALRILRAQVGNYYLDCLIPFIIYFL